MIWRPVLGYEGIYEVSDAGMVRSLRSGPLKLVSDSDGYLKVNLCHLGARREKKVHLLVLDSFKGTKPVGMQACHKDGNKQNNDNSNLRWDTPLANSSDKKKHGTMYAGERHYRSKFTNEDIDRIRESSLFGASRANLASCYGVVSGTISCVVLRKTWDQASM